MITLKHISKSFNEQVVLDGVDLSVSGTDVVGLIGGNGAGKTTLFKIITGELMPDAGTVQTKYARSGYLSQHPEFGRQTVHEYLISHLEDVSEAYKIGQVMETAGLSAVTGNQLAASLSGGQKTRLGFAALLLQAPNALLLDEPTNNLDLEGLEWLAGFIKQFRGAVLLTSHDRAFLDEVAGTIVILEDGQLTQYGGNYSFYKQQKSLEQGALLDTYRAQQKYKKRLEQDIVQTKEHARGVEKATKHFVPRKRALKVAKKAKARQRRLERQMASETWIEKPEERKKYRVDFEGNVYGDKLMLRVKSITKAFDAITLLDDVSFEIFGHQHVWLSGVNGSGKSTLLNIIMGELPIDSGAVEVGENIKIGYFTQEISQLNVLSSGISELQRASTAKEQCYRQARSLHLNPEDIERPIRELSRGQIAKLEFVKLLLEGNQLLILDEPTNHLEIETREEIEQSLAEYQGAILVASHDRYFLGAIGIDTRVHL